MLYIPPTSKEVYVSSIVALNIHSPQGTQGIGIAQGP